MAEAVVGGALLTRDGRLIAADAVIALARLQGPRIAGPAHGRRWVHRGRRARPRDRRARRVRRRRRRPRGGSSRAASPPSRPTPPPRRSRPRPAPRSRLAPCRRVLRGVVLTGEAPLYLRRDLDDDRTSPAPCAARPRASHAPAVVALGQARRSLPGGLPGRRWRARRHPFRPAIGGRSSPSPPTEGPTMSTILIGVDASDTIRGRDRLRKPPGGRSRAHTSSSPAPSLTTTRSGKAPTRQYRKALADEAEQTASDMRDRLDGDRRGPPADQDHGQPLARARAPRPRRSRARRDDRRRLLAHRPAGPRRSGQHRRAAAARRTVRRRGRASRLPHAATSSRSAGSASPTTAPTRPTAAVAAAIELARAFVGRARDHRRRRSRDLRGLRHAGRRGHATLLEDLEHIVQESLDAVIAGLPADVTRRERAPRGRPGRPARRAQRERST